ncbi:hypothetical protein ACFX5U_19000 [Sphingobacterium sp. SG20118]|uniref:hypothetical protein n=1 Tax=Sphingobacterium sp. SG20118 TaxID=3367156 RepID=UPI0037DFC7FD
MNKVFTFLLLSAICVQSYAQQQYSQVFTKDDYSQVKKNVKDQDIANINNATLQQAARQLKEGFLPYSTTSSCLYKLSFAKKLE